MKQSCPHCNEECLSKWQKLFIGSASSKPCSSCGKEVTIAGRYTVLMITALFLILIVLQVLQASPGYILFYGAIAVVLFALLQIYFIPLSKNKIDEKR